MVPATHSRQHAQRGAATRGMLGGMLDSAMLGGMMLDSAMLGGMMDGAVTRGMMGGMLDGAMLGGAMLVGWHDQRCSDRRCYI